MVSASLCLGRPGLLRCLCLSLRLRLTVVVSVAPVWCAVLGEVWVEFVGLDCGHACTLDMNLRISNVVSGVHGCEVVPLHSESPALRISL